MWSHCSLLMPKLCKMTQHVISIATKALVIQDSWDNFLKKRAVRNTNAVYALGKIMDFRGKPLSQ